jgi:tetratricopeptide (TPR) repeat protein
VVVLDRLGRSAESRAALERTLELDPLDVLARTLVGEPPADALLLFDASMDFAEFGETDLALELLAAAAVAPPTSAGGIAPVAEYATARILDLCGRADEARDARIRARSASPEYCFPSGLDAYEALRAALRADPEDARALALLGMWLYSADRHEEALEAWTAALEKDTSDPVLMRNTAVALVNHRGDDDAAAVQYRRALAISDDARLWYEYDQLAARQAVPAAERLARLEGHRETATSRDDLLVEISELLVQLGRPDEALELLTSRPLQPWEGGEGRALRAYSAAALAAARALPPRDALTLAESVLTPPASLGEAWHLLDSLAEVHLAVGNAREAIDDLPGARAAWSLAVAHAQRAAIDESTFAGAEAALRLGDRDVAGALWTAVEEHAELLDSTVTVDYFATSLPALLLFADDAQKAAQARRQVLLARLAQVGRTPTTTKRES